MKSKLPKNKSFNILKLLVYILTIGLIILLLLLYLNTKSTVTEGKNWKDTNNNTESPEDLEIHKPVIYFYNIHAPTTIKIKTNGKITKLIPDFNIKNGWKITFKNNKIYLNKKTYNYLFYELLISKKKLTEPSIVKTQLGIVNQTTLHTDLLKLFLQIGMTKAEAVDFTEYWQKELNNINSPKILVSLADPYIINNIIKLQINPKPAILKRVFFVFTPYKNSSHNKRKSTRMVVPIITKEMRSKKIVIEYGGFILK